MLQMLPKELLLRLLLLLLILTTYSSQTVYIQRGHQGSTLEYTSQNNINNTHRCCRLQLLPKELLLRLLLLLGFRVKGYPLTRVRIGSSSSSRGSSAFRVRVRVNPPSNNNITHQCCRLKVFPTESRLQLLLLLLILSRQFTHNNRGSGLTRTKF